MSQYHERTPLLPHANIRTTCTSGRATDNNATHISHQTCSASHESRKRPGDVSDRATSVTALGTVLLILVAGFLYIGLDSIITFDGPEGARGPLHRDSYSSEVPDGRISGSRTSLGRDQSPKDSWAGSTHERHAAAGNRWEQPHNHFQQGLDDTGRHNSGGVERNDRVTGIMSRPRVGQRTNPGKPNLFFFLIDDMGWNDIGYHSTDLHKLTPNLDALAADGVKVSQWCDPASSLSPFVST